MRKIAKVDANQKAIVTELRKQGYSVAITSQLGSGFPDIVVGHKGINFMFELKDGSKPPSQKKLTEDELAFSATWNGQYKVVETTEEIIKSICQFCKLK